MTQKTNSHLKRELKDIRKASRDIVEISINQNFWNLKRDDRSQKTETNEKFQMETELERTQEWLNTTANVLREIGEKDEILNTKRK